MKKIVSSVLLALMAAALILGLTACSEEEITLVSKTVNGITLNVPSDLGEFTDNQGIQMAQDENAKASIGISFVGDSMGTSPSSWDEESYAAATLPNYTDVTFAEFDNQATVAGMPAVYAHYTTKSSSGTMVEAYSLLIYYEEGQFQSINIVFVQDEDTSVKSNIDAILNSITFA